jgi:purine-binding chemotaxis protein CheW
MSLFNSKDGSSATETKRFLEFYLGTESYAVELSKVKEVITPPEMTPIPKSPAYVCGLMNLRGLVLTVIDLRKKLGVAPAKDVTQNAVIIFDLGDRMVGVVVDSIQKVLNLNPDKIKATPDADSQINTNFMGILQHEDKLTMWLDPVSILETHQVSKAA